MKKIFKKASILFLSLLLMLTPIILGSWSFDGDEISFWENENINDYINYIEIYDKEEEYEIKGYQHIINNIVDEYVTNKIYIYPDENRYRPYGIYGKYKSFNNKEIFLGEQTIYLTWNNNENKLYLTYDNNQPIDAYELLIIDNQNDFDETQIKYTFWINQNNLKLQNVKKNQFIFKINGDIEQLYDIKINDSQTENYDATNFYITYMNNIQIYNENKDNLKKITFEAFRNDIDLRYSTILNDNRLDLLLQENYNIMENLYFINTKKNGQNYYTPAKYFIFDLLPNLFLQNGWVTKDYYIQESEWYENEIEGLEHDIDSLNETIDALEETIEALNEEIIDLNETIDSLIDEYQELNDRYVDLLNLKNQLEVENANLEDINEQLNQIIEQLTEIQFDKSNYIIKAVKYDQQFNIIDEVTLNNNDYIDNMGNLITKDIYIDFISGTNYDGISIDWNNNFQSLPNADMIFNILGGSNLEIFIDANINGILQTNIQLDLSGINQPNDVINISNILQKSIQLTDWELANTLLTAVRIRYTNVGNYLDNIALKGNSLYNKGYAQGLLSNVNYYTELLNEQINEKNTALQEKQEALNEKQETVNQLTQLQAEYNSLLDHYNNVQIENPLSQMVISIADIPFNMFYSLFNWNILGFNIATFMLSLITLLLVVYVIKMFIK